MTTHHDSHGVAKLQKTLVLWQVIIIGLAYIQPMTLLDTFGMVSRDSLQHVPTSYMIALIAVLLTSLSYGHMIRKYPSSGSAYTYVQKSIHPNAGFMVGWSSLLDYLLSPMVNILLANIYLTELFPDVNHWVWIISLSLIMVGVNLRGVRFVANFNSLIVLLQVLIIGFFTVLIYQKLSAGQNALGDIAQHGHDALWSFNPFWSASTEIGALITGATILCFSFTGFDSLSSLAEETKDVKKTLPRAIFLTALISGVIFVAATYFMQLYFPGNPEQYFELVDETQPEILLLVGGAFFQSVVLSFAIVTVMASGISAHAGVSRLMYVMGRDGVLPKKYFGFISPKSFTPAFNIWLAGVICLTAGFLSLEFVVALISFGALTAFSFVNLSVICSYGFRDGRLKTPKDILNFFVVPLLGFISIGALWLEVEDTSLKAGITWAAVGIIYLAWLTKGFRKAAPQLHEEKL
ncbi:APC family permease [Comamonas aquatica]|uniref:APC family permease n=1 Tax=Comamonas aquatica TaxID=225991 RepID=UPI002449C42C|nr:APC family permease [Comamonas aquatica]MDH0495931.1 APC family permease [Comamonas aquatica]MDH1673995.1 APC family permease [Comamonas aquatica]MDH1677143.1 APC family permease [Comamonas aquatica]